MFCLADAGVIGVLLSQANKFTCWCFPKQRNCCLGVGGNKRQGNKYLYLMKKVETNLADDASWANEQLIRERSQGCKVNIFVATAPFVSRLEGQVPLLTLIWMAQCWFTPGGSLVWSHVWFLNFIKIFCCFSVIEGENSVLSQQQ